MGSTAAETWSLEVVRGKDVGKRFALEGSEIVLGNAIDGAPGINLADQEGSSPKRMAAKQAMIDRGNGLLTLRDLDSPGGTFLNKRRLLTGEARPLAQGDVIQLGGVQLRVVLSSPTSSASSSSSSSANKTVADRPSPASSNAGSGPEPIRSTRPAPSGSASSPATKPKPSPAAHAAGAALFAFALPDGSVCRNWDDFLTVSSQKWTALRDELESGRLGHFLGTIGRGELSPSPFLGGSADERLDAWLAKLPTTKPNRPEIDVHPADLVVRANAGGGLTRRKLRVSNVGYRLLRATAAVEPPEVDWLRIGRDYANKEFVAVEAVELPIDLDLPERFDRPLRATIVLGGNGGSARVNVRVEPFSAGEFVPEGTVAGEDFADVSAVRDRIARQPVPVRIAVWAAAALSIRFCLAIGSSFGDGLIGPAVLFSMLGGMLGLAFAISKKAWKDAPYTTFAGSCAGVLGAALLTAFRRGFEPGFGAPIVPLILWAILGAGAASASAWFVPFRPVDPEEVSS